MSAQDFAIAHGEKIGIVIAVALCGWAISDTFSNQDIRPKDITMVRINEMVKKVENARETSPTPVLKTPPSYLEDMKGRWSATLPSAGYFAWFGSTVDVGPTDNQTLRLYVYELHPPKLAAHDAVGTIELTVTLPTSARNGDVRISDAAKKEWTLEKKALNRAEQIGLQIEMRTGAAGEWVPAVTKEARNGFVPLKEGVGSDIKLTVESIDAWQRYSFRARLVAKATALEFDKPVTNETQRTVLVFPGVYPDEPIDWVRLTKSVVDKDKKIIDRFLTGTATGPFATTLKSNEVIFTSDASKEESIQATGAIRFVYEKSIPDPDNADAVGAGILLTKLVRDAKGAGKWLFAPETFKLTVGKQLGEPRKVLNVWKMRDAKAMPPVYAIEDLSTTFELTEVQREVKRVWYYELKFKSRPNAGKAKDIELEKIEKMTEVAVLTNKQTGVKFSFPKLARITKPSRPNAVIYPNFAGTVYDEEEEFKKNPQNFQQLGLVPPEPIAHDPGTGPLEELHKRTADDSYQTDTKYYELADGRLVYWEHVNNKPVIITKPGSEAEAKAAEKPALAPTDVPKASDPKEAKPETGTKADAGAKPDPKADKPTPK